MLFSHCIHCFQFLVYIAETKCTEHLLFLTYNLIYTVLRDTKRSVYTSLKNLHLNSLNQMVSMAYCIIIRTLMLIRIRYQNLFIIHLCTKYHFIFFMNKTKSICSCFAISFCTFGTVYCQNRSLNIHFAHNGQECLESANIREM